MEPCTGVSARVRVLGLGNQILADDAFGILAAREVKRRLGDAIEVLVSFEAGFNLIDCLLGASPLVIVDTIQTGAAPPGTIHILREEDFHSAPAGSPHCAGICEVLSVARILGLAVPARVTLVAVEAADCATVGGAMHPDVLGADTKRGGLGCEAM